MIRNWQTCKSMGDEISGLRNTKWTDVQINYGIQNGQTYKSTTGYEMSRGTNQIRDTKWTEYKSTTGYKMGRRSNQPRDTKWTDVQINYRIQNGQTYKSTTGYKMGGRTNQINCEIQNGQTYKSTTVTSWADI